VGVVVDTGTVEDDGRGGSAFDRRRAMICSTIDRIISASSAPRIGIPNFEYVSTSPIFWC